MDEEKKIVEYLKSKYPFIDTFVENMSKTKLNEYCLNKIDLTTWFSFLAMYINVCHSLTESGKELTEENIAFMMKMEFNNTHYVEYINYLHKIEFIKNVNTKLIKDNNKEK